MSNPNPNPATRFQPGVSGNPRGGPRGWGGLRRQIKEQTGGDGQALVEFALAIFHGSVPGSAKAPDLKLRWEAFVWLSERIWGKAVQPVDLTSHQGAPQAQVDYSELTAAELDLLERIGERQVLAAGAQAPAIIDVDEA